MRLTGQKVLITGGASGLGLTIARELLPRGNTVMVCARSADKLTKAKAELPDLLTHQCDLDTAEGRDGLIAAATERMEGISVLMNNAGTQVLLDFTDPATTETAMRKETETNLLAPIFLTQKAIPLLLKEQEPAIINVSSGLALIPKPTAPMYSGSKAGLHLATQGIRAQLWPKRNIRVFEILPGQVKTETTWGTQSGEAFAKEVIGALERDQWEILPGKMKWLALAQRFCPPLSRALVRRMARNSARMIALHGYKLPGQPSEGPAQGAKA